MPSEALKIARLNARRDVEVATLRAVQEIMRNPIIELVGGFVLVEWLQRFPANRPIIGNLQGNLIEAGIGGVVIAQQIAPMMPYLVQGTSDLTKLLGPVMSAAAVAGA